MRVGRGLRVVPRSMWPLVVIGGVSGADAAARDLTLSPLLVTGPLLAGIVLPPRRVVLIGILAALAVLPLSVADHIAGSTGEIWIGTAVISATIIALWLSRSPSRTYPLSGPLGRYGVVSAATGPQTAPAKGAYTSEKTLVFTHIPKTAGTSLRQALMSALETEAVQGFDRAMFGGFSSWESLDPGVLATIDVAGDGRIFVDRPRLVCGHFSAATTLSRYPDAHHMTVLREGRSRLLSLWMFWRARTAEDQAPWGDWGTYEQKARGTLEEFLLDPDLSCLTDNATVRSLLWPHPLIPNDGRIDPRYDRQLLREARSVLRRYAFVDVVENPDLVKNLGLWLQTDISLERKNVSDSPAEELRGLLAKELTPGALVALLDLNRLDAQLWGDVARATLRSEDPGASGDAYFATAVARYSLILAGIQVPARVAPAEMESLGPALGSLDPLRGEASSRAFSSLPP